MNKIHKEPNLVVAYDLNRGIGNNNDLPWRGEIPADMKHFKELTLGNIVLMGRTTYESIGRPLPSRENRILTRQTGYEAPGCKVYHDPEEALLVDGDDKRELFVIGGEQIYQIYLPFARYITASEIDNSFEVDTFFPVINEDEWEVIETQDIQKDDVNKYGFSVVKRKKKPKFIDVSKARSDKQHEQFRNIEINNVCPFCTEHLEEYHEGPVLEQGDRWAVIANMIPYENTDTHFVIIPNRHILKPEELTAEEWVGLGEVVAKYTENLSYGGLAFRFGEISKTGASVAHLHIHILKPKDDLEDGQKVRFKISR